MKKTFILLLICLFVLIGCKAKNDLPTSNGTDYAKIKVKLTEYLQDFDNQSDFENTWFEYEKSYYQKFFTNTNTYYIM